MIVGVLMWATLLIAMVLIYLTFRGTRNFEGALNEFRCLVPEAVYSSLFLTIITDGGSSSFTGVVEIDHSLGTLHNEVSYALHYMDTMQPKRLLKFSVHGLYAPFVWTDKLVNAATYDSWPSATQKDHVSFTLNSTVLGYEALRQAGVLTDSELTGPYAPVFAAIDAMGNPSWDSYGIRNGLNEFNKAVGESDTFINWALHHISSALNSDFYTRVLMGNIGLWLGPLYMLATLPIVGIVLGFLLFLGYVLGRDSDATYRNASTLRLSLTGLMAVAYAGFGIFLMLLSGASLIGLRLGHAGCDFFRDEIMTKGNLTGLAELDRHQQDAVDHCVKTGGDGHIISSFIDMDTTHIFDSFIDGNSWDFPLSRDIQLTPAQLALQDADGLGLVVPRLNKQNPKLTVTSPLIYWGSYDLDEKRVDCSKPGNKYVCDSLDALHGGKDLDPSVYPWASGDPYTINGLTEASEGLTSLVAQTPCHGLVACVDADFRCLSEYRVGPGTIGHFAEDLILGDIRENWESIKFQAAIKPLTRLLFSCFDSSADSLKLQWANGVRWVMLRQLMRQNLRRVSPGTHNDQSVSGQDYFDPCLTGASCPTAISVMDGSFQLIDMEGFGNLGRFELQSAYQNRSAEQVVARTKAIALESNPFGRSKLAADELTNSFSCGMVSELLQAIHEKTCPGVMSAAVRLMFQPL
eukprot:Gregarina_sp_Poly_1__5094@NODE_269_length_10312_cov_190_473011_g234_i0_p3_GENE_NODE_269_length_10312_cov_190_473011_g234_i0NODE_269_length_10312_cov_190_473011_g234_i0_p3_ORF_typecomplete_len690_score80_58_NODE_269_length_10312_cov_190_473011_g234_i035095578